MLEIVAGWEPREAIGYQVFTFSAIRRATRPIRFVPLMEKALRYSGIYSRPHEMRDGQMYDVISDAPMATSFACSRFLTPWLVSRGHWPGKQFKDRRGRFLPHGCWILFCDGADMLFTQDPADLFALADDRYAVQVVKHEHVPDESLKMDNQAQTVYARKNWSSVILWNCTHPANARLTQEMVNTLPGRDLHRFCWLEDHEIGELPPQWNYLAGVDPVDVTALGRSPSLIHFTRGLPIMPGYEDAPWANVWKIELEILDSTRGAIRAR